MSRTAEPELQLHWRLRADIQVFMHDDYSAVLKDPLTGSYMLLVEHELAALRIMERSTRLSEWHELMLQSFPARGISRNDLREFLLRLCRHHILQSAAPGSTIGTSAAETGGAFQFLRKALGSCLRVRLPVARPVRAAETITRALRFLFTPTAVVLYILLVLLALAVITVHFSEFRSEIPTIANILGVSNLAYLFGLFLFVKFLHEAAHIVSCTHFGAKVRDCGLMFLFFTPVLYTNVSDAWILPRKQRILISAAGILTELGLAAIFTLLWWGTARGPVRCLLMNGILLCTVSTLIFNGNPLLKFDGYFVLTDLIRCPNLYQRSIMATQEFFSTLCIGTIRAAVSTVHDTRFLIFGVMVCLYRGLLCLGLCSVAGTAVSTYGMNPLDLPVRGLLFLVLAVFPLWSVIRQTIRQAGRSQAGFRLLVRTCALLGIVWLVLLIPVRTSICVPCVFVPDGIPIYAQLTGRLLSTVPYGESIVAGQEIAELQNDELRDQLVSAEGELSEKTLRMESLKRLGLDLSSGLLPTAMESRAAAENQLHLLRQQIEHLKITAPESGILQAPEETPESVVDRRLSKWSGTPLSSENIGATVERGTLLGYAGSPSALRVVAVLHEEQAEQLRIGEQAFALGLSGESTPLSTTVSGLSTMEVGSLPGCLVVRPGNEWLIADKLSASEMVHSVSCKLSVDGTQQLPALYSGGFLKMQGVRLSLGTRLLRFLRKTIFGSWI